MIKFFKSNSGSVIALSCNSVLSEGDINALSWLFDKAQYLDCEEINGYFVGPTKEMITPWSTTAVEITRNMKISGIERIEEFFPVESADASYDRMLQRVYSKLDQSIFTVDKEPQEIIYITDFHEYNKQEGLALSDIEIKYLEDLSAKIGRALTDSEVFGFSQVNSEHCRHKIFNGTFIIDGKEMESSLFKMIKETSAQNPNSIVSAYKDNCAFIEGPTVKMFHPKDGSKADFFQLDEAETVISLKAETHNFPTTVEPFNGAATGSGGEIRDRIAGGKGSFPIAGTAAYMTSYPRFEEGERPWESSIPPRKWLYQTPLEILIKASNGASDFGNKFGQPLICGSLTTFEHQENNKDLGYDKVIMLAGGIGYAKRVDALKDSPVKGDKVVLLGGDNYRIGMGGGAVSSVATGEYDNSIELNAVQRSNPEMQKRSYNAIRALSESSNNPIVSIHDHGAGGHLNCLSELVEDCGGTIDISKLPIGDPTRSLTTFEHQENNKDLGYDKVIMLAGGIGYAKRVDALKDSPVKGDKVVLLGGDNYRIGMGGGAVSSVATGEYDNSIELNAVQRSNPEMQKRSYNAIRALSESSNNPIVSIHDHGAGGHLNCLSELVEDCGGTIDISKLPIGDPTLSAKEIIGNESQERMGLVLKNEDVPLLEKIAKRERAPFYVIGEATGEDNFTLVDGKTGKKPIDLQIADMLGKTPKTVITDNSVEESYKGESTPQLTDNEIYTRVKNLLQLESVACKDWLTNKVDRSVTGLVANQQCAGDIQLPINDLGVTAIGYEDKEGIATSIGSAPSVALIDSAKGSQMAIAEALTNVVFAPLKDQIKSVSLSANWMWPAKNSGEDARLYKAVKGASDFAIALGINIPTGKDSMSMTQKYPDGSKVFSPGTLIVSTVAAVKDVAKVVKAAMQSVESDFYYIPFVKDSNFALGGSAYYQTLNLVGNDIPEIDAEYFKNSFNAVQNLIDEGIVLAGHDVSQGGMITTLLEMAFAKSKGGMKLNFGSAPLASLFSEQPGVVLQVKSGTDLSNIGVSACKLGSYQNERSLDIIIEGSNLSFDINSYRDIWYKTSYLFDKRQSGEECATERFENYKNQPLEYKFAPQFDGNIVPEVKERPIAAIIREKGSNGDREMAYALYLAGFDVKDVHTTDLISGEEKLEDVRLIVFVGGFSNADTLGSAKGWAGALLYNEQARTTIENYYAREDTLSLGICNGCQLMTELGLVTPKKRESAPKMKHNNSHKFESGFVGVTVTESPSIMLKSLRGSKLGIWVAHGEGKFDFPTPVENYNIALKYNYNSYPANPNGSPEACAGICSDDGRHLAMMPHPERCLRPWNWPYYPAELSQDKVTPWVEMFVNARKWVESK